MLSRCVFSRRTDEEARVVERRARREEREEDVEQLIHTCHTDEALDDVLELFRLGTANLLRDDLDEIAVALRTERDRTPVQRADDDQQLSQRVQIKDARLGASGLGTR